MLTKIIARFFQLASFVVALFGVLAIIANLGNKPIRIRIADGYMTIGRNGLVATANENFISLPVSANLQEKVMIGQQPEDPAFFSREGATRQEFQVMPTSQSQRILFACRNLLFYGLLSFGLYLLFKLFLNFSREQYNKPANVRYARYCSVAFLLIFVLGIAEHFLFFSQYHPVKTMNGINFSQYQFPLETESIYLLLSAACYVLAQAFKYANRVRAQVSVTI